MLSNWNKRNPTLIYYLDLFLKQNSMDRGDYVHALLNYEHALSSGVENENPIEHQRICQSGIARSAVGSGDVRKGISLALKSNDPTLMKQCATILEDSKVIIVKQVENKLQR